MDTDTTVISLPLVGGGYYTGTVDDCLQFLYKHRTLVEDSTALRTYFHYSESKEQYVYVEHMHPNYIRNALIKYIEGCTTTNTIGLDYVLTVLSDDGLPNDLVAQAVRTWFEMVAEGVDVHTEALLLALEGSEYQDNGNAVPDSGGSDTTVLEGKVTIIQTGPFTIEVEVEGPPPPQDYATEVTGGVHSTRT